jgi:hypothetical protein
MFRILATSLAALMFATPIAAFSQDLPSYAQAPQDAPGDQQLRGRITNFDGGYSLTVRDERGFIDNVSLHPGTIINPTGLTLAPGMVVSILGYNAGGDFAANEIDTPYSYDSGVPYYSGHPWNYYGSGISLGFFFGNVGWWHGNDFRGGFTYYGGARYYSQVRFSNFYNGGGSFRGRAYIAPASHGGYYRGGSHTNGNVGVHVQNYGAARAQGHYVAQPVDRNYARSGFHENAQYRAEGHAQSQYQARPQGHAQAYPQGHAEGRPQGHAEGSPQGHPQNHAEGHHDGGHQH